MKKIIITLLCLYTTGVLAAVEELEVGDKPFDTLVVNNALGDIRVTVVRDNRVRVLVDRLGIEEDCRLSTSTIDRSLIVNAERFAQTKNRKFSKCRININIQVPAVQMLDMNSEVGSVVVQLAQSAPVSSGARVDACIDYEAIDGFMDEEPMGLCQVVERFIGNITMLDTSWLKVK